MAHRNSNRRFYHNEKNKNQVGRETNVFSNPRLPRTNSKNNNRRDSLRLFEDRREYHPQGSQRPARGFRALHHRLKVVGRSIGNNNQSSGSQYDFRVQNFESPSYLIGFVKPKGVLVCVRRKIRSEIMHALGYAGLRHTYKKAGAGGRSEYSSIRC